MTDIKRQLAPGIYELDDGTYAITGTTHTTRMRHHLPPDAGIADHEDLVVVNRKHMLRALARILLTRKRTE